MDKQSKKLELSKETLLSLEDQDLADVVGGQLLSVNVGLEPTICNSGAVCNICSVVCNNNLESTVCL